MLVEAKLGGCVFESAGLVGIVPIPSSGRES
jgi:hypothetical protein